MIDWVFRCKTCNAMLDELAIKSTNGLVQCPYCFNIWTIPKKETSSAALQFLRMGEHDLDTCKFDDALSAYKKAAELDPEEPEAHFGMALAEFKIQYLKDHVNNRLQPICHETTEKKFTESKAFRKALTLATGEQGAVYEKKGTEIDYILGEFYRLKKSGLDYDCFLCVKVTDDSTKQPTEDGKDADYIYRMLQDKGYKPFYSERELRNVTGADYEARILYALYVSECMLVICRNEAYLQTPWVKNEYTRFLKLVNDEEKESDSVTIVFHGIPVERLPGRNGKLQGIDFAQRDAEGRILNFVENHTPEAKAKREAALRKKAEEEARRKAEEETRRKAEEERRLAFEKQQKNFEERQKQLLEEQRRELEHLKAQSQAAQTGNLSGAAPSEAPTAAGVSSLLRRMDLFLEDKDWDRAKEYAEKVLDIDPENAEAYLGELFAELKITKLEGLSKQTQSIKNLLLFKKAYRFANKEFKAKLGAIAEENQKVVEAKKLSDTYANASAKEQMGRSSADFLAAAKLFESLSDYEDSAERAKACREKSEIIRKQVEENRKREQRQREEKNKYLTQFQINNGVLEKYVGQGGDVFIPNGVTSILRDAFNNQKEVTSVVIPDSVTEIGWGAFMGCHLKSLQIGNGVTLIKGFAFYFSGLRGELLIPDSVISIGDRAFHHCMGLTSVTIGKSVADIGESAFYGCSGLTDNLFIPDNVTSIGDFAFCACNGLKNITIGNGLTEIGKHAFKCKTIKNVTIPKRFDTGHFHSGLKKIFGSNYKRITFTFT